jgi:hypothetical protein
MFFSMFLPLPEGPQPGPSRKKTPGKLYGRSTAWTFAQTEPTGQYTLAGRYLFDNQHYAYNPRLYLRRGFSGSY